MKSKNLNSNKTSWNPYNKNIDYSNFILLKENSSVFQSIRETVSNISIVMDSLDINTSTSPVNSETLQVSSSLLFFFSS